MTVTIPTAPDEETPLLGGQRVSAVGRITESDSKAAMLPTPSNQGSRTASVKGKTNANGGTETAKKTPLPWAQFSIILLLQFAEPLTAQVIYPVSSLTGFSSDYFTLASIDTGRIQLRCLTIIFL